MKIRPSKLRKIETVAEEDIPEEPGAYIMLSDNTEYIYPWSESRGKSRVYYIGQASNLRDRLATHKKFCLEAKGNPNPSYYYYWPRYEYAAYHGCNICWVTCKSKQEAKQTEENLLFDFANYYGAKPVANSQSAWR
jgi:excinuclease UvrABC nuclease subunit